MRTKNNSVTISLRLLVVLCVLLGLFPVYQPQTIQAASLTPSSVTTANQLQADALSNPAAPVLVVYNSTYTSNKFSVYLNEILRAEGFNFFDTEELSNLSSNTLSKYDVVILAQTPLNRGQSLMFINYVNNGGNLLAFRPDTELTNVMGLGTAAGTLNNGYVAIQTNTTYGQDFPPDSLQLHTPADQYTNPSAQVIAKLYTNATTATNYPAVTLNSYGAGKAVAFTYDLASSVVYTRQGNPAQIDSDSDGDGVARISDLYYNWIDLNKMPLPQADLQQRLFAKIISQLALAKKPLPRFWYFPNAKNTAIVLTSDAHGNPDSYYANIISSLSNYNATTTFMMAQSSQPSAANVAQWKSQGFGFTTHPYKVDTPLSVGYDNVDNWFNSTYGTRTSRTTRVHRVEWQGWVDAAKVGVSHGYKMDFTPYRYGLWLKKADNSWTRGYMTGSGLPMKFIDQNGVVVDNFGQYTEITDDQMLYAGPENLSDAEAYLVTKQAIDNSENGYNQAVAFQLHVDYYAGEQTWAQNSLAYARSLNLPLLNADQWLNFTEARYNSTFSAATWATNTLSFTASIPTTQSGQTVVIPLRSATGNLTSIKVNGSNVNYTSRTVKGESVALVVLPSGNSTVAATYVPDTTPPVISSVVAAPLPTQATISWNTNELATTRVNYGTTTAMSSNVTVAEYSNTHTVTLTGLNANTTYYYQVVSVDQFNNRATSAQASFTTPNAKQTHNQYIQFAAGTPNNTAATAYGTGEVKLLSGLEDTFAGTSVDTTKWNTDVWSSGGSQAVSNGYLNLGAAYLQSKNSVPLAGKSFTARIKFTPGGSNQHFGPSPDLGSSWFIFSVPSFDTNNLYARTNYGSVQINEKLTGIDLSQYHTVRIEFTNTQVNYYVDSTLMATHTVTVSGSMPVWFSAATTAGPMQIDWVRYNNYASSGTFISLPFDAGTAVKWNGLSWTGNLNGGTVQIQTRSSGDSVNWTAWSAASSSSYQAISTVGRYLQYQLTITTPDSTTSPELTSVTVTNNPVVVDRITIAPATANLMANQTAQFSATAYDANNNALPGMVVSWSVVNGGGSINSSGLFTATTVGTFNNTVAASAQGKTGYASVVISSPTPTISQVSPNTVANNVASNITITGANFVSGASVKLGTTTLTSTFVSATSLTATIPAGTATGTYSLTVTNPDGSTITANNAVTVTLPAPTLSSVSPNSGSTSFSVTITLSGNYFVSGASVKLGTTTLTSTFVSATSLTATVPAGTATGTYSLTVTNPDGQTASLANAYTVTNAAPAPTISTLSPNIVTNTIANEITIKGSNFTAPSAASLKVGTTPQPSASLVDANTITFLLSPNFTPGTYDVSYTNSDGQSVTLSGGLVVLGKALVQTNQTDFANGTATNTRATTRLDGEVRLMASLEDYFETNTLNSSQWASDLWGSNGSVTQSKGTLTLKTAYARSLTTLPFDRLQGRLKFASNSPNQHFGFSDDLSTSWLLFSVPGYNPSQVYARTNINGVYVETPLNITLDTFHDFMMVVANGKVDYYVDGTLLASHTVTVSGSTYVWLSAGNTASGFSADSVIVGSYPTTGTFLSAALDAGQTVSWSKLYWSATGLVSIKVRSSVDGINWSSWSTSITTTGSSNLTVPDGRYFQYQLDFTSSNPTISPEVQSVAVEYP